MGDRQVVRHGPLEPVFGGSNPFPPAILFLLGNVDQIVSRVHVKAFPKNPFTPRTIPWASGEKQYYRAL